MPTTTERPEFRAVGAGPILYPLRVPAWRYPRFLVRYVLLRDGVQIGQYLLPLGLN